MDESKQPMQGKQIEPVEINKLHIETLEIKIKRLEIRIEILEVLLGKLAMANGIRVEKFQNGLVVISDILNENL